MFINIFGGAACNNVIDKIKIYYVVIKDLGTQGNSKSLVISHTTAAFNMSLRPSTVQCFFITI